ncbi:MAG TPA: NAD-dependent succinate-semialdehyde dehydrogenase [Rickettsiales bacterium]|nr:NAD-dependent succinate-semialdehyde dehydrogenase [Rickettsiales bacterium]
MQSINPVTGELIREYEPHTAQQAAECIEEAHARFLSWKGMSFDERAGYMRNAAVVLRKRKEEFAALMADEMGKPLAEGRAEIEKCAATCEYYAEHAQVLLKDEKVETEARSSFITWQPLGVILAIMPWNFPFWQVFRFAAPNLMAGNVGVLKHASNVCGCALAIEDIFREAGFPKGCFSTLLIGSDAMESVIAHKHVRAVTLTGSTQAGKAVAGKAAALLKKTVLELGGSDPYVVLADANVKEAAIECAKSRLINAGQSCIAAKRFIVVASVREEFERHFLDHFKQAVSGNPHDEGIGIGPLAREDLRDTLHSQVEKSVKQGAKLLLGGKVPEGKGSLYPPTVLSAVRPGMTAFEEELFGPVAAIIEAKDEEDAFMLANASAFGLGSAIFTSDMRRAEELAKTRINAGQCFVNAFVRSDPHLPFGGVGESGYGRELGALGIREFMNAKTVYIA